MKGAARMHDRQSRIHRDCSLILTRQVAGTGADRNRRPALVRWAFYQINFRANCNSRLLAAVLLMLLKSPIWEFVSEPVGNRPVESYEAYSST